MIEFSPFRILTQLYFIRPIEISQGDILDDITVYMKRELFMNRDLQEEWKNFNKSDESLKEGQNSTDAQDQ